MRWRLFVLAGMLGLFFSEGCAGPTNRRLQIGSYRSKSDQHHLCTGAASQCRWTHGNGVQAAFYDGHLASPVQSIHDQHSPGLQHDPTTTIFECFSTRAANDHLTATIRQSFAARPTVTMI